MRGFFAGSLLLIVLYVGVQKGTADKAEQGSKSLLAIMRRALSPEVAGVPDLTQGKIIARKLPQQPR